MNKIAAGIAASAIAVGATEAEERRNPRVAPLAVYDVAPGLGHFTDDVLFGDVWKRTQLAPRDRSIVTVASLISMGRTAQVGSHVGRALDNGVKPEEIGELITQLAFYSGWPNAMSAVTETKKVFETRGIGPVGESTAARIELEAAAEQARGESVDAAVAPTAPELAALTNRVLFGDLWQRPDLTPRDRSLVTMAALVAIGQPEQLPFHLNRAMDNGLTREEAAEVVTHIAFYAGWPRAMSAVTVVEKVFAARSAKSQAPASTQPEISITRAGTGSADGPAAYFTGGVKVSGHFKTEAPARVSGATVSFAAGARTAWHTHPLGQTLFVVSGRGFVQKEGGSVEVMEPGDVVFIAPHVKHWHGATADTPMTHLAVAESLNGSVVTWMEMVSDEQYGTAPKVK
jgi:4-carboxymuconolactone decarboxylase